MRGDVVFRVYGVHASRPNDLYFGTFQTRQRADEEVVRLLAREMHGENWAARYHDRGFEVREFRVETDFELPSRPKPRDAFHLRSTLVSSGPHTWDVSTMEVFARTADGLSDAPCARWERDHAPFGTFEPFRQGDRMLALISRTYTQSAVIDLCTSEILAEESLAQGEEGFCPVGFYVPDWWDVHDASIVPGSEYWTPSREGPSGELGLVWGCEWGDDATWKLQALDLRDVQRGVLRRDERFGYLPLATGDWESPVFDASRTLASAPSAPPPFLSIAWGAAPTINVRTEARLDVTTGEVRKGSRNIFEALLAPRPKP